MIRVVRPTPLVFIAGAACLLFFTLYLSYGSSLKLSYAQFGLFYPSGGSAEDDYFRQLSTVRPLDTAPHSRTMGVFNEIYAISLQRRADRREQLDELFRALRLDLTYIYAVDVNLVGVTHILEHVRRVRGQTTSEQFAWPAPPAGYEDSPAFALAGSDLWMNDASIPAPPDPDTRDELLCYIRDFMPPAPPGMPLTRPRVASWASHIVAVRRIADNPDPNFTGLILEDDVDFEWDIERRVRAMWPALPEDWDVVMLGHCWSTETKNPALKGAPNLHPSHLPLCAHAYGLSRNGARRLLNLMRYEPFAYSRPFDNALQHLIMTQRVKSFSVAPPIAVQRKNNFSDIWVFKEPGQKDWLVDSTAERVALLRAQQKGGAS